MYILKFLTILQLMIKRLQSYSRVEHIRIKQVLEEYSKMNCQEGVKDKEMTLTLVMITFGNYTGENAITHNLNQPYIPNHPLQTHDALLNLTNKQPDIDKIYLHAKYLYEAKYQSLINKKERRKAFY